MIPRLPITWRDEDCECHGEPPTWGDTAKLIAGMFLVVALVAVAERCGI